MKKNYAKREEKSMVVIALPTRDEKNMQKVFLNERAKSRENNRREVVMQKMRKNKPRLN